MTATAIRVGACASWSSACSCGVLQKPAEGQGLWDSIQQALQLDRERRAALSASDRLQEQLARLSAKEMLVLELLASCFISRSAPCTAARPAWLVTG